jgi:hypothetical protein
VAGAGNLISGNDFVGVRINGASATGNLIQGNLIGTQIDESSPLGNTGQGVRIDNASNNTIGGTADLADNLIAHNSSHGVAVVGTATGNAIQRNEFFANGGLGIDLGLNGVTANDIAGGNEDSDVGANNLQNFPLLTAAVLSGDDLDVTYSVPSNVAHSAYPLTVDFFLADGPGQEGQTFLGSDTYLAGEALNAAMITLNVAGQGVSGGSKIVATATDSAGNTSEFSTNITVSVPLLAASDPILSAEACQAYRGDGPVDAAELAMLYAGLPSIINAAILRWQQAGVDASQLELLDTIDIQFAELDGAYLGLTTGNTIFLDANAAGYGWFVSQEPRDKSREPEDSDAHSGSRLSTLDSRPSSLDSQLRMDLLTAVMHEMGHVLGLEDVIDDGLAGDVMFSRLQPGTSSVAGTRGL